MCVWPRRRSCQRRSWAHPGAAPRRAAPSPLPQPTKETQHARPGPHHQHRPRIILRQRPRLRLLPVGSPRNRARGLGHTRRHATPECAPSTPEPPMALLRNRATERQSGAARADGAPVRQHDNMCGTTRTRARQLQTIDGTLAALRRHTDAQRTGRSARLVEHRGSQSLHWRW
jgi:hypothetical protein